MGDPELREEIAQFYKKEYDVTVDPDCMWLLPGSSPYIVGTNAFAIMTLKLFMSNPGYLAIEISHWHAKLIRYLCL